MQQYENACICICICLLHLSSIMDNKQFLIPYLRRALYINIYIWKVMFSFVHIHTPTLYIYISHYVCLYASVYSIVFKYFIYSYILIYFYQYRVINHMFLLVCHNFVISARVSYPIQQRYQLYATSDRDWKMPNRRIELD